ncbi:MAG: FAD-dependent oxidoreductase [Streptosporangiaceae bacterium]|jgi:3-phenylpropionate/trans-cinnamate dioxygenase ferredoxin reductase subunit
MPTFVIAGGGLAGAKSAQKLRSEGFDGRIVILGGEKHPPYERPPLSKGYLLGNDELDSVYTEPESWYAENDVDLRTGVTVASFDPGARTVTAGGETVGYDKLLIATGAVPRRLDEVPGAYYLRTIEDSTRLKEAFAHGGNVVVVGAGWIGLEAAAAARTAGCEVTVIERGPRSLHAVIGSEVGAVFTDLHKSHGVRFKFGETVQAAGDGYVTTSDGERLEANVVLAAIGVAPDDALAREAGLEVGDGILADAALRTSAEDVFAAGDVVSSYRPLYQRRVRVEHWHNAIASGEAAAQSMLGQQVSYDPVPYFYSDQYNLGMECAGLPSPGSYDQVVYRGSVDDLEFIAFWLRSGAVIAGMNVNVWDVTDEIQALIRSGRVPELDRLTNPSVPLAEV